MGKNVQQLVQDMSYGIPVYGFLSALMAKTSHIDGVAIQAFRLMIHAIKIQEMKGKNKKVKTQKIKI